MLCCVHHVIGKVPAGVVPGQAAGQHLAIPQDDDQHVVEVVRDSAGEPSDRLHPLGLAQRFFGATALGHVRHRPQHPGRLSVGVAHDVGPVLNLGVATGPPLEAVFPLPGRGAAVDCLRNLGGHALPVFGVDPLLPPPHVRSDLVGRVPE